MLHLGSYCGALLISGLASAAYAQSSSTQGQQPSMQELLQQIDALRHRVDELEGRERRNKSAAAHGAASAPDGQPKAPVTSAAPTQASAPAAPAVAAGAPQPAAPSAPHLLSPEPMGDQYTTEDALRSDLPGLSFRVPGTQSEIRFYGFANVNGYRDFNARNQTDAPSPQTIPLANSPAALQGGDFGLSARFSRFGVDTRTATALGTLETRLEGDFGGGAAASLNQLFRLRQAWGELGTESFRVLVGQANSLWNEGVYETVNFATNLNQSFVRQPQLRVTASLAPGLTGQVSFEFPDTQFTSTAGVFTALSPSPSFTALPDLLARLEYRNDGMVLDLRGLVRDLSMRTAGTTLAPPAVSRDEVGWGVAGTARLPMRWLSPVAFGPDELIGMAYYGEGIGRYFGGNTSGQDALSNIGLPNIANPTLDPLTTYGVTAAYRRFWTTQLRSNFVYSFAWQNYPAYALLFTSGTNSATSLNSNMQQAIVNMIWSPFAELRDNYTVGTGWLDVGLEYVYTHRDVFGGNAATGSAGSGYGTANRILSSVTMRF
jgi:hypothetical protein